MIPKKTSILLLLFLSFTLALSPACAKKNNNPNLTTAEQEPVSEEEFNKDIDHYNNTVSEYNRIVGNDIAGAFTIDEKIAISNKVVAEGEAMIKKYPENKSFELKSGRNASVIGVDKVKKDVERIKKDVADFKELKLDSEKIPTCDNANNCALQISTASNVLVLDSKSTVIAKHINLLFDSTVEHVRNAELIKNSNPPKTKDSDEVKALIVTLENDHNELSKHIAQLQDAKNRNDNLLNSSSRTYTDRKNHTDLNDALEKLISDIKFANSRIFSLLEDLKALK